MRNSARVFSSVLLLVVLSISTVAAAPPAVTVITIPSYDCPTCGKAIYAKLRAIPNVAGVQMNLDAKTALVTPQANKTLSPRLLWEAVEKANHQPSRLEGPNGTFTSKPQS
jgi:Cu+-exporting ATPase